MDSVEPAVAGKGCSLGSEQATSMSAPTVGSCDFRKSRFEDAESSKPIAE